MTKRIFSGVSAPQSGDTFRETVIDLGLGKMAAQIGNAFVGASEEFAAKEAMQDFNENDMAAERQQSDAFFDHSKKGANWRNNDAGYAVASDKIRDDAAAKIADPDVKKKFIDYYNKKDAIKRNSLRRINYSKQSKARVADLNASITGLSDDYMKVTTQEEREVIEASVNGKLDVAAAGGWITPEEATKHKKDFKQNIRFTVAAKRLESDPAGVLKDLGHSANKFKTGGKKALFVQQFLPYAIEQGKKLGIDPRIILAQSAIETGWGRKAPGNNYFGIKSHGQKNGQKFTTHEYIDGKRVVITDSFKGYANAKDSYDGYGNFLTNNPRYREMLNAQGLEAQVTALGKSGYATDPNYAKKVYSIAKNISGFTGQSVGKIAPHLQDLSYTQIDKLRNAANTQLNVQYTQLDTQHELLLKNVGNGIAPQVEELKQIGQLSTMLGREDIAQEMRDLNGIIAANENWKTATIDDVRTEVSDLKKVAEGEKATNADVVKADFGTKKLTAMEKSIKKDPLQYAIDAGQKFIEPMVFNEHSLAPLNIEKLKERLAQRSLATKQVGKFYGNEARYFTNNERNAFSNMFQNADAEGKRKLSALIYQNFGDDLPKALNEIARNGAANALTISLASQGNEAAANLSNAGAVALRDKTVKLPPEKDILTKFNVHVSTAIPIGNDKLRSAVLQVAKQIYAGKMATGTIAGGDLNETGFSDSVNEALGKNGDKGGIAKFEKGYIFGDEVNQTIVLAPNLSKEDMVQIDADASSKTLEKLAPGAKLVHGNGDVYRPENLAGDYKISVGSGRYAISVTDPKVGIELVGDANKKNEDGTLAPAIFDYNNVNNDWKNTEDKYKTNNKPLTYREFDRAEKVLEVDDLADFLHKKGVMKGAPPYRDADMKQGWGVYKTAYKKEWNEKLLAHKNGAE